jgi:esterase FrsA
MGYEFEVDVAALLEERHAQFVNLGLPAADLDRASSKITDMWKNAPGGWVYEFSALAAGYAQRGDRLRSSLAYGVAKFPVLANEARHRALRHQLEEYLLAAPDFGLFFERQVLKVPYRGTTTPVPVHLLSPSPNLGEVPVMLFSGGIDTWKMDLHALAVGLASAAGIAVMAFDIPGTGETQAPLDAHADDVIYGLIAHARQLGNGRVAHFGLSFGGNFSAMSGLAGAVDAAIDLGGPVDASFAPDNFAQLMFGMADIAGNAYGFTAPQTKRRCSKPPGSPTGTGCSTSRPTQQCWSSTAPTTSTYPKPKPSSSTAGPVPTCT